MMQSESGNSFLVVFPCFSSEVFSKFTYGKIKQSIVEFFVTSIKHSELVHCNIPLQTETRTLACFKLLIVKLLINIFIYDLLRKI